MLNFGYEAWVTALGNRYIAAIVIAAALILRFLALPPTPSGRSRFDRA
jgi:hypothetical protein